MAVRRSVRWVGAASDLFVCPGQQAEPCIACPSCLLPPLAAPVEFYQCTSSSVCKGEATAGNVQCEPGRTGTLCAVCEAGYYRFAGTCRWVAGLHWQEDRGTAVNDSPAHLVGRACGDGTQATAMLAVTATFFAVIVLILLARTWGVDDSAISKIKIFVTHFQAS